MFTMGGTVVLFLGLAYAACNGTRALLKRE